jgi:hypothetical protein
MLERAERIALTLLRALSVLALVFAALGVVLITLGYDEVWLLESWYQLTHPVPEETVTEPVLTSGGPYALANLLVLWVTGPTVIPARLVSLGSLLAVLYLVYRTSRRSDGPQAGWIALAVVLATPGALFYGATAFAEMPALLLSLLTSLVAARAGKGRWPWWIGVGVLAALAAATRVNAVLLLPSLLVLASPLAGHGSRPLRDIVLAAALGGVVFALCLWVQALSGTAFAAEDAQRSTGFAELLPRYPMLLNNWRIATGLAPFPVLVAATAGALWVTRRDAAGATGESARSPWLVLLPFAWLAWMAWILKAPIPHLRYLWPTLPCIAVLGGHALGAAYHDAQKKERPGVRLAVLALSLSLLISGLGSSLRELAYGDHDAISLEWSSQAPVSEFRRFRPLKNQRAAAEYLAEKAKPDEVTLAIGMGRAVGYLAQRTVVSTGEAYFRPGSWPPPKATRVLVCLLGMQFLHEPGYEWLAKNAEVEAKFGPYVFYRVKGPYPEPLETLIPDDTPYPEPIVDR